MAGVVKTCVWLVFSCIHCLFWIPIVIVTVSIIWGYYVYVYLINITAAGEGGNNLFHISYLYFLLILEILEKPLGLRSKFSVVLFLMFTNVCFVDSCANDCCTCIVVFTIHVIYQGHHH